MKQFIQLIESMEDKNDHLKNSLLDLAEIQEEREIIWKTMDRETKECD